MKLLIVIDQEGCSNVTPALSLQERNKRMIQELEKFIRSVPKDWIITVLDCHDNGLNVLAIKPKYPKITFVAQLWNFNIDNSYDLAVLIGFHAAYGVPSPFSHTFRNEIVETLLNNENVGEATLITKWLNSHNIPVGFIHGEHLLENEVQKLNIPFIPNSKTLLFSLQSPHFSTYHDINPIRVKLINDKLLDAFPSKIFNLDNNYLIFDNINKYINSLSDMSIFLNAARNYFLMHIKKILNLIKWHYSREEIENLRDERLNNILGYTDLFSITIDDINYLESIFVANQ